MSEMDIDPEVILVVPFSLGAMISTGLLPGDIFGFFNFADVVIELGGQGIAWSHLISILSLVAVVVNRDKPARQQITGLAAVEAWVFYATIALLIAPPLMPAFESAISQQPAAAIAVLVQTAGFGVVSYVN